MDEEDLMDSSNPNESHLVSIINNSRLASDSFVEVLQEKQDISSPKPLDCVIKCEGVSFGAHKEILAKSSSFFEKLFEWSPDTEYEIKGIVTVTAMRNILATIYNRPPMLDEENVPETLQAAHYFDCPKAVAECSTFLMQELCPENCLGFWMFSVINQIQELEETFWDYISLNFFQVSHSEEWLELPEETVGEILKSKNIKASEANIFHSLMNWIQHQKEDRLIHLPVLIQNIRLACCLGTFFQDEVLHHPVIKEACDKFKTIEEMIQQVSNWISQGRSSKLRRDAYPIFAQPRSTEDVILALQPKRWGATKSWVYVEEKWKEVDLGKLISQETIKADRFRTYSRVAALNGQLYICEDNKIGYSIDLCNGSTEAIAPMKNGLKEGGFFGGEGLFTTLGDHLICGDMLQKVEVYSPLKNEWKLMPMPKVLQGPNVLDQTDFAVSSKTLFLAGGYKFDPNDEEIDGVDTVLAYSEEGNQWKVQAFPQLTSPRYNSSSVALDENLFVLGGFNNANNTCLKSVEKLNTSTGEWTVLPDMTSPRDFFGCVLHKKKIFCFGGNEETTAEMLDLESKQPTWKIIAELPEGGETAGLVIPAINSDLLRNIFK